MDSPLGGDISDSPVARATVEPGESPSTAIPIAVAAVADVTVTDLPSLGGVIDPDAVDCLFRGDRTGGYLAFRYAGFRVVFYSDDRIEVYRSDAARADQ